MQATFDTTSKSISVFIYRSIESVRIANLIFVCCLDYFWRLFLSKNKKDIFTQIYQEMKLRRDFIIVPWTKSDTVNAWCVPG